LIKSNVSVNEPVFISTYSFRIRNIVLYFAYKPAKDINKMRKNIIITAVILAVTVWQCTKDEQSLTLKESIEEAAARINTAFDKIAASEGYRMLSVTDDGAKSDFDEGFRDSIDLKFIAGIYDFKPGTEQSGNLFFPIRLFIKTAASDKLIVNLPDKLVFQPRNLHFYNRADPVPENNFKITATNYHFYYNRWNNSDYRLDADFFLNSKEIGTLSNLTSWRSATDGSHLNNFTFPDGYSVTRSGETGNTSKLIFALALDKDTLLKETLMFSGEGFGRKEKLYILSVGNVDIMRRSAVDSIQVYLDGVLQKTAGVKIIDDQDYNASICYRRDIQLTFDDGTIAKLSELISPARETIRSLSKVLGGMYFSKQIVDYIAFSIYYNNH